MFDSRAAQLQQQAIEALSDLRTWIWGRHGALLPDDLASITREEAERYAAYLDWYSRVEEVLLALAASAAQAASMLVAPAVSARQPHVEPAPARALPAPAHLEALLSAPTVRVPSSHGIATRADGWQPMIAVRGTAEVLGAAPGFKAA